MRRIVLGFALLCVWGVQGIAQEKAVPAEQEPKHHVILKNEDVMVIHATLQPGESTAYHIHSHNRGGVQLTTAQSTQQVLGKPEEAAVTSPAGEVWCETISSDKPLVHRVRNPGNTVYDVIDVEFLKLPSGQDSKPAAKVEAENPSMRIYKWDLAAGATSAMHTHTRPYLVLAATEMTLKMSAPDGQSRTETVKPGDVHWITTPVTHAFTNGGDRNGEIVEFELK